MKRHIKHVVLVVLENRSFDNILGWLYDGDPNPTVNLIGHDDGVGFHGLTDQLCKEFAQPLQGTRTGERREFPIQRGVSANLFPSRTPILDPIEGFDATIEQLFGSNSSVALASGEIRPTMDGFLQNYYRRARWFPGLHRQILQTYDFVELPVFNNLSKEFGVADLWFGSIPSQTFPNLGSIFTGGSLSRPRGETFGHHIVQTVNSHYQDWLFKPEPIVGPTIWNALDTHGLGSPNDWRIYYSTKYLAGLLGRYPHSLYYLLLEGLQKSLDNKSTSDRQKMYRPIERFYSDVVAGDLPAFTLLDPKRTYINGQTGLGLHGDDLHPPANVAVGEKLVGKIYETLRSSGAFDDTLLVIVFDEHGGTFDHVAPPWGAVNPHPEVPGEKGFDFTLYGVRVPAIFISSWIPPRTIIRSDDPARPFDHTSISATLLNWVGVPASDQMGARVSQAPTFDGVISGVRRSMPELGAVAKG